MPLPKKPILLDAAEAISTRSRKHLLNLSNGSYLKVGTPWEKGPISNWYKSFNTSSIWELAEAPKGGNYKVDLFSSGTSLCVIAADHDHTNFSYPTFNKLNLELRRKFKSNEAVVCHSPSGKIKVFFAVDLHGHTMTNALAFKLIKQIYKYEEELIATVDPKGVRIAFLSSSVLKPLFDGLPYLKPILSIKAKALEIVSIVNTSVTTPESKAYRYFQGDLETLFPEHGYIGAREHFLRIMLECSELLTESGFGLSTTKAAKDIGVCPARALKARNYFEKIGWIKNINRNYVPNEKAMTFVAEGDLREALTKRFPSNFNNTRIPAVIPDHKWNEELGKIIRRLEPQLTLEETLTVVKKIAGSNIGDRLQQARKWYQFFRNMKTST